MDAESVESESRGEPWPPTTFAGAVQERALVFTQYAEMGALLSEHLAAAFGREVWEHWERPKPRHPADGIRAQTQSGKFGKPWWAGRWIAALERLVDSARLSRGRSYARSGQVVSLDVGRAGVRALVQGSRPKPYQVSIEFRVLTDPEWEKVVDAMAEQALYAARLLSGEMPEEIEAVFAAAGVSLFPSTRGDLETSCSCPDWANPCKHVAAVHYLLGERFDADPFLMFELSGRTKQEVGEALRQRRSVGQPEVTVEEVGTEAE